MLEFLFTKTHLSFLVQSLWRDEAFSILLAQKNMLAIITLTALDFSPPFYPLLLHFWIKIFGVSEIAVRSLSIVFFCATISVFWAFITSVLRITSRWKYAYLFLFIINPFLMYYAFEARSYMAFAFFASCSFYFFLRKNRLAYTVAAALGLYTHYFMVFVLMSQAFFALVTKPKREKIVSELKTLALPVLFFVPWLIYLSQTHSLFSESFWIREAPMRVYVLLPAILYTGYEGSVKFYENAIAGLSLLVAAIIAAPFFQKSIDKKTRRLQIFFLSWVAVPTVAVIMISFYKPLLIPRYLIFTCVGLVLLIIWSAERAPAWARSLLFGLLLIFTLHYNYLQINALQKRDIRAAAREIKSLAKKGDLLYVTNELNFHTAQYYFGESRVYIFGKTYEEIPNFVGKVLIPAERIVNALPVYPRKAFILKDDMTYDIQAIF